MAKTNYRFDRISYGELGPQGGPEIVRCSVVRDGLPTRMGDLVKPPGADVWASDEHLAIALGFAVTGDLKTCKSRIRMGRRC